MPTRKNINKSKGATDFGPTVEDDEWDAKSMTSLSENAGSSSQLATTPADMAPDLDVIQRLEMRSDFATKFLNAIHDVKRDVWDFSGRMDEAEERISKVEDAVYTEKGKTEELIKQVDLLKHKMTLKTARGDQISGWLTEAEKSDAIAFLEKWLPEALQRFPRLLSLKEPTGFPLGHKTHDFPDRESSLLNF